MSQGAIFDFNGTMAFDAAIQERSWRTWARHNLGRDLSDDDFTYHLHGASIENCLEHMLGHWPSKEEVASAEAEREQLYRNLCLIHPNIYHLAPGLPEFLDALVERGVHVNIASSSPLENMMFHFEQLGLGRWFSFDEIAYNDRTFPSKPAPDIFLRAASRMGVPASSCIMFEDAPLGLESARRAGAKLVVAVASEYDAAFLSTCPGVSRVIADYLDMDALLAEFSTTR